MITRSNLADQLREYQIRSKHDWASVSFFSSSSSTSNLYSSSIILGVSFSHAHFSTQQEECNFMLNGSPYYANGFNAYWLMYVASDPSQRPKVSAAFKEASSHGLTVARTWAFSDGGYSPLQYAPGSYNQQMFKGLDVVVDEARRYGIKLVLSLANNYESYGGKKQCELG